MADPIGYRIRHVRIVGVPPVIPERTLDARQLGRRGGGPLDVRPPEPAQLDSIAVRITRPAISPRLAISRVRKRR